MDENLGEVMKVGDAVEWIKVDGMVCLRFNISSATAKTVSAAHRLLPDTEFRQRPASLTVTVTPTWWGQDNGGQAEYLRVPHGDFNCLKRLKLSGDAARRATAR